VKADAETTAAVLEAARAFMGAYERGDIDEVMRHIAPDEDVVMIGTGADEKRIGPTAARRQVERDHEQAEKIALRMRDPLVSARGDVAWLTADVAFEGTAGGEAFTLEGRMTGVFEQRDGRWLMANSHFSAPMAGQEDGSSY
jgi:ketosteroid isomerase-like protein